MPLSEFSLQLALKDPERLAGVMAPVSRIVIELLEAAIANDSDYGLSGSVWTADAARGLDVARRVRTGSFGVNQPYTMDPAAPFGGIKASGIGRELGREGYVDLKAISGASLAG
jgi:hypothetical protein